MSSGKDNSSTAGSTDPEEQKRQEALEKARAKWGTGGGQQPASTQTQTSGQAASAPPKQQVYGQAGTQQQGQMAQGALIGPQRVPLQIIPDTQDLMQFFSGEITRLVEQIAYDGMDPKMIRKLALEANRGDSRMLIMWLVMYINWGSKFYQKDKRSKNERESAGAIASLKMAGVHESKKDGKLTLSRMASAHAPLVMCVRRMLIKQENCPSSGIDVPDLPLEMHDLALACYSGGDAPGPRAMHEYLKKFAMVLHKAAVKARTSAPLEEAVVMEEMEKYRLAAVGSLATDSTNKVPLGSITINSMLVAYGYPAI